MTLVDLLAARRVGRPQGVFAKRSWPPGCGHFSAARDTGETERGVVQGSVEAADYHVDEKAACNGGIPRASPYPQVGSLVQEGDGDVCSSDGQRADSPVAALESCAAIRSPQIGRDGADLLPLKGMEDQGSGELTGDGDTVAARSSEGNCELERKEDGGRKKRWLTSLVNPPPKTRAVSAMRRFPACCGRAAAAVTDTGGGVRRG